MADTTPRSPYNDIPGTPEAVAKEQKTQPEPSKQKKEYARNVADKPSAGGEKTRPDAEFDAYGLVKDASPRTK